MDLTASELSESDLALRAMIRSLVAGEIAPRAVETDRDGAFPSHALRALAEVGLLGVLVPEEYGGAGGGTLQYVVVVEEIARACGATAVTYMTQVHSQLPIMHGGDDAQKTEWLPALARGDAIGAIALTEPDAGSDVASLRTAALLDNGEYVVDGRKMFATNGGRADLICVLTRTGPAAGRAGLGVLLVPGESTGVRASQPFEKMGIRGSETVELTFDGVRVPERNLLGGEGDGFAIAMRTLDGARLSTAAQALGLAQGAYDIALRYALEREQFGKRIFDFQAVQFRLVDMATAIESSRALLHRVACAVDRAPGVRYSREAAMAKVRCSDLAMKVTTDAVQTLGGYGYMQEYQVERYMRDAKITQIYDGTNDINRVVIGRELEREARGAHG